MDSIDFELSLHCTPNEKAYENTGLWGSINPEAYLAFTIDFKRDSKYAKDKNEIHYALLTYDYPADEIEKKEST